MDYAVLRSRTGIRAVELQERGKGLPKGQEMTKDEYFGAIIDNADSPDAAVWKAALKYHSELIKSLTKVLELYLEEINCDRDRPFEPEVVDEAFRHLKHFRQEGITGTETLGEDLEPHWVIPADPEAQPVENPDQLSLL